MPFNKANNLHCTTALWALKWIDFINTFYQCRPGHLALFHKGCITFRNTGLGLNFCRLFFPSHPSLLIGVESIIAYLVFPFIRNMLCHISQKIKRLEHLKVTWISGGEFMIASYRKGNALGVTCTVKNIAFLGSADHSSKTERTT